MDTHTPASRRAPLVMLHGFGSGPISWGTALGSHLHEHGIDLHTPVAPGHDGTPIADPIDAALDALDTIESTNEPAWLGGWSMGGYTALRLALRHPHRVQGLILLATGAGGDTRDAQEAFQARAETYANCLETLGTDALAHTLYNQDRFARLAPADKDMLMASTRQHNPKDLARVARTHLARRTPLRHLTGTYPGPALILVGEHDPGSAPSAHLRRLLPNADVITLSDTGHAVHLEHPEQVASRVARLILNA